MKRYVPTQIVLEDPVIVQALQLAFSELGVELLMSPASLHVFDGINIARGFSPDEDKRLGLLEIGVSIPMAADFFSSAHAFFLDKPWDYVKGTTFLQVRYHAGAGDAGQQCCMVIMGNPAVLKHHPRKGFITPDLDEVVIFAASLRTIPGFVRKYLSPRRGEPKPATVTYDLPPVHMGKQITLSYLG